MHQDRGIAGVDYDTQPPRIVSTKRIDPATALYI